MNRWLIGEYQQDSPSEDSRWTFESVTVNNRSLSSFIDGLRSPQIQLEVRRSHPRSLHEAFECALQELGVVLEQLRASGGGRAAIKTLGTSEGETVVNALDSGKRGRGRGRGGRGRSGFRSRGRPSFRINSLSTPGGGGKCWNCKEVGHLSSECTKPRVNDTSCWNCGRAGHLQHECKSPGRGRGRGNRRGRASFGRSRKPANGQVREIKTEVAGAESSKAPSTETTSSPKN